MTSTSIQTIGVLGAGQMGAGIAQVAAQTGYTVLLADVSQERADAGKAGIVKQLGRLVVVKFMHETADARTRGKRRGIGRLRWPE